LLSHKAALATHLLIELFSSCNANTLYLVNNKLTAVKRAVGRVCKSTKSKMDSFGFCIYSCEENPTITELNRYPRTKILKFKVKRWRHIKKQLLSKKLTKTLIICGSQNLELCLQPQISYLIHKSLVHKHFGTICCCMRWRCIK
jgi:hypothetical protein